MRLFAGRRPTLPPIIGHSLSADESVLVVALTDRGEVLAATRFGLWVAGSGDGPVERWGWNLISKATLAGRTLSLVRAEPIDTWPDGIVVLVDRPARPFTFASPTGLTDIVHARVRGSVRASAHLDWPRAGGWVVLRRTPGVDGLTTQIRLDSGADPMAPGFAGAVAAQAAAIRAGFDPGDSLRS